MAIFVVGRPLAAVPDSQRRLELIREISAVRGASSATGHSAFLQARVPCRRQGGVVNGASCGRCPRFVNDCPVPDSERITVRCSWRESDRLTDLMIPIEQLVALPADATVGEARRLAEDYAFQHFLYVDHGVLAGVVRRDSWGDAAPEEGIAKRADRRVWLASDNATIADAADMLDSDGSDYVLVVRGQRFLGLVTRDELCEVGYPQTA